MPTFYEYDPIFRNLIGSGSSIDPDAYRKMLADQGKSWIETEGALPGGIDLFAVNVDRQFVLRQPLPAACRLADGKMGLNAIVPSIPELPAGGVVAPEVGSPLPSGFTTIVVRAPFHLDHQFMVYVETPGDRRDALIAHAAARRDAMADGGIGFRGHVVASDDRCAGRVLQAIESARRDVNWSTVWECADGAALPLDGDGIVALHDAIEANRGRVFARYSAAKADIVAGTITAPEQVDAAMASAIS